MQPLFDYLEIANPVPNPDVHYGPYRSAPNSISSFGVIIDSVQQKNNVVIDDTKIATSEVQSYLYSILKELGKNYVKFNYDVTSEKWLFFDAYHLDGLVLEAENIFLVNNPSENDSIIIQSSFSVAIKSLGAFAVPGFHFGCWENGKVVEYQVKYLNENNKPICEIVGSGGARDYSLDFDSACESLSEIVTVGNIKITEIVTHNIKYLTLYVNGTQIKITPGSVDISVPKNSLLVWDIIRDTDLQLAVCGVKYQIL